MAGVEQVMGLKFGRCWASVDADGRGSSSGVVMDGRGIGLDEEVIGGESWRVGGKRSRLRSGGWGLLGAVVDSESTRRGEGWDLVAGIC